MPADSELSNALNRRQKMNQDLEEGKEVTKQYKPVNVYIEFNEFHRNKIKQLEQTFNRYKSQEDGHLHLEGLKKMMEDLKAAQTHIVLKTMIGEVDEDGDGCISFREFLIIFRKANAGELEGDSGLGQLARLTEVDVGEIGVQGAKTFFEAKIENHCNASKFEDEIRKEQEDKRREEENKTKRHAEFKQKVAVFTK